MKARWQNVSLALKDKGLDALIVTNPVNIFYLTSFKGVSPEEREALAVISPQKTTLVTARLYQAEAKKSQKNLQKLPYEVKIANERAQIDEFIKEAITSKNAASKKTLKIGFEEHNLTFWEFRQFKKLLKGVKLVPVKHLIEDTRTLKTDDEIAKIEKAQIISQLAFVKLIKTIKPGQTEAEIAQTLVKILKSLGSQSLAFDPIVASGKNSAKPHHVTGNRKLAKNDILLLDFGAKYQNYCADLTRTIFIGKVPDTQREIYRHVKTSQEKALKKIKSGIAAKNVHKSALSHFKKNNLNQFFIHSLGHGIGLQVHEKPSLSEKSKDKLKEGMVFSIEPGLYFQNWGGVRIEDLVVVSDTNVKLLGKPSQFIQI